jgi:hypothetical protein
MSLNFSSEFVAYTFFVNIEMYELYIPCIFIFMTIYVFCGTILLKGEISSFLQFSFNRWDIHTVSSFLELKR